MILDDHKNKVGKPKPFGNRKESNTGNTNQNNKYQFQTPQKPLKMKKADTSKDFSWSKRNDSINNNSDSSKDNAKTMSNKNLKTKAHSTAILGDSILKNVCRNTILKVTNFGKHVVAKNFSGAKVENMRHYMKLS